MTGIQPINFTAPTEYTAEEQAIARQRALAQMLQQQGMSPIEQQPTAGGFTVPISPYQGLAKMLQGYAGMRGEQMAGERERALSEKVRTDRQSALARAMQLYTGTPGREVGANEMGDQGYSVPARQGDMTAAGSSLLTSGDPLLSQIGGPMLQHGMNQQMLAQILAQHGGGGMGGALPVAMGQGIGGAAPSQSPGPIGAGAGQVSPLALALSASGVQGGPEIGKMFQTAQTEAGKPVRFNAGGGLADATGRVILSAPQNGIQNTFGPGGVATAAPVPGHALASANQSAATAAGTAYGRLPYEPPAPVNFPGQPYAQTPSQQIQTATGAPPPTPQQLLAPQTPVQQAPEVIKADMPTDQQARDMAVNLSAAGKNVVIRGPQPTRLGVRLQDQGETETQKTSGRGLGELDNQIRSAGLNASRKINQFNRLGNLLENTETGKLQPAGYELAAYAQSIGLPIDAKTQNFQAAKSLANEMALQLRNPEGGAGMPGNFSDQDRRYLQQIIANIDKVPGANKLLIDGMIKMHQRDQEIAKLGREYKIKHGGVLDDGFFQEVQDFSEAHPLFPKASIAVPSIDDKPQTLTSAEQQELDQLRQRFGNGRR
jgi:hypothetical protein